ncbi:MAG: DUF805 domain-containing protein [Thiohalocapsa sp.]
MFKNLWGDLTEGRLRRLPFLGWYLVVALLAVVAALGVGASMGAAERMGGGEIADTQQFLTEQLGIVGVVMVALLFGLLLFAQLNISTKRIRDMGLPSPWLILFGLLLLGALFSGMLGQSGGGLFNLLVLLALLLIPTASFGAGGGSGPLGQTRSGGGANG